MEDPQRSGREPARAAQAARGHSRAGTTPRRLPGDPLCALREEIRRAKSADPLAPVTVLVPSNYAGISLRRRLAGLDAARASPKPRDGSGDGPAAAGTAAGCGPGTANVRFATVDRLAEILGAAEAGRPPRAPLSAAARREALRFLLGEGRIPAGGAGWGTEALLDSLDRLCAELEECDEDTVSLLTRRPGRTGEVASLFRSLQRRVQASFATRRDLAEAAVDAIVGTREPSGAGADGAAAGRAGPVIAFSLGRLRPSERILLDALGDRVRVIADAEPRDIPAELRVERVISAADPDDEVRAVLRRVVALAARWAESSPKGGAPLWRQAILYPPGPYERIIHQQLDAARIPFNGIDPAGLEGSMPGRCLVGFVGLAGGEWRRDDVISWLTSAPIVDADGTVVPAALWDAVSARAGVVAGLAQWSARLRRYRRGLFERGASPASGHGDAPRPPAGTTAAEAAEAARALERFIERAARLAVPPAASPGGRAAWSALARWAGDTLDRLLAPVHRGEGWPDTERDAYQQVMRALDRIAALDPVSPGGDIWDLKDVLGAELTSVRRRRGTFGEGILAAPLAAARGLDVDVVFLVGMAEIFLPGPCRESALIPDADRALTSGALPLSSDRRAARRAELAAASATATEVVMSFPRAEPRAGKSCLPSRWLIEAVRMSNRADGERDGERDGGGASVTSGDLDRPGRLGAVTVEVVPSFAGGIAGDSEPSSVHDLDLRHLSLGLEQEGDRAALPHRVVTRFDRFSGLVGPGTVRAPADEAAVSPTGMEKLAACPMRFLLEVALRVGEPVAPEEIERIEPLQRGRLVHAALDQWVTERLGGAERSPERLAEIARALFDEYESRGETGHPLLWEIDKEKILRDLARIAEHDLLEPLAAEVAFGGDSAPAVHIEMDGARLATFHGRIDRIDTDPATGALVVTDYKTGKRPARRGGAGDPVAAGTQLQLPVYAIAARQAYGSRDGQEVRARYWYVSETRRLPGDERVLDGNLRERLTEVVAVIAGLIAKGAFPARPGAAAGGAPVRGAGGGSRGGGAGVLLRRQGLGRPRGGISGGENCAVCPYDRICPADRAEHWATIREDPLLAAYVAMAEPGGEPGNGETVDEPA